MRVLVIGIDSDIGQAIAQEHRSQGDDVETTSRNGKGTHHLELVHPLTWPVLPRGEFDRMYYCIGVGDARVSRAEVMQINAFLSCDCVAKYSASVKARGQIVVLSSGWGSIGSLRSAKAPSYRMSKAALNMGIACIATRDLTRTYTLMNPGMVSTKMTKNLQVASTHAVEFIRPEDSARSLIQAVSATNKQFSFIDYNGAEVSF